MVEADKRGEMTRLKIMHFVGLCKGNPCEMPNPVKCRISTKPFHHFQP